MTWLEIIDSTIKIGLGAFIGGIFTYLLNKQMHAHEINKEILLENRQTLKDVCAKFENIHANVIDLLHEVKHETLLYMQVMEEIAKKVESAKSNAKIKIPKAPDFLERRLDVSHKMTLELYSLQGVLMLYGYNKMSSVIHEYTSNILAISPRDHKDDLQGLISKSEDINKFTELRNEFYDAANYYLSAQNSK